VEVMRLPLLSRNACSLPRSYISAPSSWLGSADSLPPARFSQMVCLQLQLRVCRTSSASFLSNHNNIGLESRSHKLNNGQRFAAIDRAPGVLNFVLTTTTRSRHIATSSSTAFIISLLTDEARRTKARRVSACQYSMAAS
jgi:hypothetical protein